MEGRALGKVAAQGDRPLVVDLDEDGASRAQDRGRFGKETHHVGPAPP